jgi:hypothetical protein
MAVQKQKKRNHHQNQIQLQRQAHNSKMFFSYEAANWYLCCD